MKSEIMDILQKIEKENDVTILYACESGSRAWGFDNAESDYDIRFIFKKNNLKEYISLSNKDDVIDFIDEDLDIVGWDIKKALLLHYNSNPNLREWLISPIKYIDFEMDIFKDLPDFDKAILKYHYTNIAANNWKRLSRISQITKKDIKMYLYNCRCIITWMVINEGNNPSINIFDLLEQVEGLNDDIREDIMELIGYYKNNCQDNLDLNIIRNINEWMEHKLFIMKRDFPKKDENRDLDSYDERFLELVLSDY